MIDATHHARGHSELDPFYILSDAPQADEHSRVLKDGDTFGVFDHHGDIHQKGLGEQGLYYQGTRFLSRYHLRLGRDRPLFLSSAIRQENDLLTVNLTNPDIADNGEILVARGTVHILRTKFLWQDTGYERIQIKNHGLRPISLSLNLFYKADFVDIFEVRGSHRDKRGQMLPTSVVENNVYLSYRGLDGVQRRTHLAFHPTPTHLSDTEARFRFSLAPNEEYSFDVVIVCEIGHSHPILPLEQALAEVSESFQATQTEACTVVSSKQYFNDWINRSVADLHMLCTTTATGSYPYAGIPWFSTPFGRDGILTALSCLWIEPAMARGVLSYLSSTQAQDINAVQDSEPGKILHEARHGEMAALGEIPFGRYYGSVDSTPLFILLAGEYYQRTGDRDFLESLWPHIEAALTWIDTYGDADQDGFVEYARRAATGLGNQGWKDSHDSIFHADGALAEGPIALCEVQAYVYGAKRAAARLAEILGRSFQAVLLTQQASLLRERFNAAYWCDELDMYAIALDGAKRPCRVRSSNAGHCLFTGIATPERATRMANSLMGPEFFSGWGIRTIPTTEPRYNPMSYHNGSIWPHDNAVIAYGLAQYGRKEDVMRIMNGLFEASLFVDLHRLPELFCGFPRRPGEGPTLYPVACSPQAWAAASVFQLLYACLGMQISAGEQRIFFRHSILPAFLKEVTIRNLQVGEGNVDLQLVRHEFDIGVNVLRREGQVEIAIVK